MKRALTLAVMLASTAAMTGQASAAAAVSLYGSVKLQWNVASVMKATVHTNYTAAFANGGASSTDLPSAAGVCPATGGAGNADLTIDFGTIQPAFGSTVACTYTNAVGVSVQSNDNLGFTVYEYLDAALPVGTNLCAFPNGGATLPVTAAAAISTSGRSGAGPATFGGSCAAGGANLTNAGAVQNAGSGPVSNANISLAPAAGEYASAAAATGQAFVDYSAAAGTAVLGGEDLQLNIGPTATTGSPNVIMTLQFVAK